MSVAFRSCAARTLSSFSGCDDKDGGDRRSVRGADGEPTAFNCTGAKSDVLSKETAGAIVNSDLGAMILNTMKCPDRAEVRDIEDTK